MLRENPYKPLYSIVSKNTYILIILSIIMNSFVGWAFKTAREKKKKPENRLLQISDLIDWLPIRKHLDEMYKNKTEKSGRANCDGLHP